MNAMENKNDIWNGKLPNIVGETGIVDVTYISVWDGGYEIDSNAKFNVDTNEVFDIQTAEDEQQEFVDSLDYECIQLPNLTRLEVIDGPFGIQAISIID